MQLTSTSDYLERVVHKPLLVKTDLLLSDTVTDSTSSKIHEVLKALSLRYKSKNLTILSKVVEASLKEPPESPAFVVNRASIEALKNDVIINPKRGEAFICLNIDHIDKKGSFKQGSPAIRVTAKKAQVVWQLTSLENRNIPAENTPKEFLLAGERRPRICPKPYGRFPNQIKTQKNILNQEISFYEYYPFCLSDLHLKNVRKAPSTDSLSKDQLLLIIHSLIKSLVILHENKALAHGDIKKHNILVNKDKTSAVFCDFDKTGGIHEPTIAYGTHSYTAPEYLLREDIGKSVDIAKADIYALGVTCLATLDDKLPSWCKEVHNAYRATKASLRQKSADIAKKMQFGVQKISSKALDQLPNNSRLTAFLNHLAYSMLHPVPEKRPSAKDLDAIITKYKLENKIN